MASAPSFTTDRIRNVVVVGHGGAGKTTLIDACCHMSGATRRHGSSAEGTALTMFTPEEVSHGISMNASVAYATWEDAKINFIDTPGYLDFQGETKAGVRVADGALVCISGPNGVEVGTERVWDLLQERHLPAMFFVTMMDRPNADFERVYRDVKEHLTPKVIPVEVPIGSGEDFKGIVNLFADKAYYFHSDVSTGEYDERDIPDDLRPTVEQYYNELIETIASTDDTLLEHYLEGDTITREEAIHALKQAMLRGDLYPLLCGVPTAEWGTRVLLTRIVELMPSPQERPAEEAQGRTGNVIELRNLNSDPFAALVFKTTSEPHVGELTFFRIFGGSIKNGGEVLNASRDKSEKLTHLSIAQGKERFEVDELRAGDIGVVAKLRDTHTNDTLSSPAHPLVLAGVEFPDPDIAVALEAANRNDEDKLSVGLHKLHEEDPCFAAEYNAELGQTIARGLGELHLEVQIERLRRKNGVEVVVKAPRIPYRETIRSAAEGHGRHKKQTGGRGQFGDAHVRLKPLPRGSGYKFTDSIVGGVIPGKYVPAVDKGVQEAAQRGFLAGFPMVDFEAEVYFGSYHSVDSSEQAFKMAGILAFHAAAEKAQPAILEPVMEVEVFTDSIVGGVIPGKYVPAVDKGVQEAAQRGFLAGFPMVDFEAEVYFGSYHSVDSSEQAFKMAGILAFHAAAEKAQPAILEPVMEVEVFTPDDFLGDVIGDLNQRRGQILGMEQAGRNQVVRALVPQAELYKYSTTLRSLSQGRATHTRRFHSYQEVPSHEVPKLVEAAKKEREELAAAR